MKSGTLLTPLFMLCPFIYGCFAKDPNVRDNLIPTDINETVDHSKDPFVGNYKGSAGGNSLTLEIKRQAEGQYHVYTNGLGPDFASLQGEVLKGSSAGLEFFIRLSDKGVILNIANQDIAFTRDGSTSGLSAAIRPQSGDGNSSSQAGPGSQTASDPFEGIYDVSFQGQVRERWTIRRRGNSQYDLISPSGSLVGSRNNNQISGFDNINNISFTLGTKGSGLVLNVAGVQFDLINRQPLAQASGMGSNSIDNRLLGVWSGSSSYNSYGGVGDASISFGQAYGFKADGTYEYKDFNAGGGAAWSTSSEGGIQTGTYQIIRMDHEGGVINVNGRQMEYVFFSNGSKMKMGSMIYNRK